ncbi:aldehyde dehydrogenase family protein [Thauera sp.]|uniref:aldehyde dehydrogenase family protein n=1 Tax=Thauera sp. TaxID=1905334 RepID=UPI0039E4BD76
MQDYVNTMKMPVTEATRRFVAKRQRMLIGGEWLEASDGLTLDVFDPATGQAFAKVPAGGKAEIDRAVSAARKAFDGGDWAAMRAVDRERLLMKLAELVEANAQELAELEALDNGKPVAVARFADVALVVDSLRYMAGWATKIGGETMQPSVPIIREREFWGFTRREAVGVVGAIIPWNFPLLMAAWKMGPALASGCTMVLKPAEETPLSALRLAELVQEAGYPAGVFNVVTGLGHVAGAALSSHPHIDKLAFTGSTEIGKLVGKAALDNMTRISLELGGKSPMIVLDDADVDAVAAGAAHGIFFNSGQVCTAGSRLFVHKKKFDQVVEGLSNIAAGMKVGAGLDPDTQLGPLVSAVQQERVMGYIRSGFEEGARAAVGGETGGGGGYFVKPTVLVDAHDDMRVVREEIFGPVVVAMPYDDLDEVARRANDTPYGLAASIWSNDLTRVHRLIPKIKAGTVWVNCHTVLDNSMPFGGFKQSGIGREMGRAVFDQYTELKSVLMAL